MFDLMRTTPHQLPRPTAHDHTRLAAATSAFAFLPPSCSSPQYEPQSAATDHVGSEIMSEDNIHAWDGREGAGAHDLEVASTWADEEDQLSREKLQMIKARTMYEMVEEIDLPGGPCKLLFLTNVQADLLGSSEDSLQKMLDALEVPKPQLVINLLSSHGFEATVNVLGPGGYAESAAAGDAGIVSNRAPFLTHEEENACEQSIDDFMADVLIPLAAQTNAVVITSPFMDTILTTCLMRMYSVQRSKWGGRPPFTIISAGSASSVMYCNPDTNAVWRDARRQSRAWRARDKKLLELTHKTMARADGSLPELGVDFDPNCTCVITTDMIESKKEGKWDKVPFNTLQNNLIRYLAKSLPSLTIKTGSSDTLKLSQAGQAMSCLDVALNAAQSGSPVLFLDVRERPLVEAANRIALIEATKAAVETHCDALLQAGLAESFSACLIAYLYNALVGDVKPHSLDIIAETVGDGGGAMQRTSISSRRGVQVNNDKRLVLHEAIQLASDDSSGRAQKGAAQGVKRATAEQASQLATWLAHRYFKDSFQVLVDKEEREERGETYQSLYKERIVAMQIWAGALFNSPNFHQINLRNREEAKHVVRQLVRLDRLPKANTLEELHLLREAWCEYDVCMRLATWYKRLSKFLFAMQLLMAWSIVLVAALRSQTSSGGGAVCATNASGIADAAATSTIELASLLGQVLFSLSMAASFLISLDALLNAKTRWRHLRSSAGALETIIWSFRARVGAFELEPHEPNKRPATVLCAVLNEWRSALIASGDLKESNIARSHGPHVYRHHQFQGSLGPGEDDYHSTTQPQRYIDLRIIAALSFYQRRIPRYTRQRQLLQLVVLLCSIAVATLSHLQFDRWVILVTSAASLIVSWTEFADLAHKGERYTLAAQSLKKLLSWWNALSEVEKASKEMITRLIDASESTISDERSAWLSTASDSHRTTATCERQPAEGSAAEREAGGEGKSAKVHPATFFVARP